jgi:hypothetical protein
MKQMSSDYERKLETEIERRLKALPVLMAPTGFSARVMAVIAQRANLPWYRQSWPAWPVPVRILTLLISLALFGLLCFAGWEASQLPSVANGMEKVSSVSSAVIALWNAMSLLLEALLLATKQLGTGFILGCLGIMVVAYGMCVGLGSVYLKLSFARR